MIAFDPFAVNTLALSILSLVNKMTKTDSLPRVRVKCVLDYFPLRLVSLNT